MTMKFVCKVKEFFLNCCYVKSPVLGGYWILLSFFLLLHEPISATNQMNKQSEVDEITETWFQMNMFYTAAPFNVILYSLSEAFRSIVHKISKYLLQVRIIYSRRKGESMISSYGTRNHFVPACDYSYDRRAYQGAYFSEPPSETNQNFVQASSPGAIEYSSKKHNNDIQMQLELDAEEAVELFRKKGERFAPANSQQSEVDASLENVSDQDAGDKYVRENLNHAPITLPEPNRVYLMSEYAFSLGISDDLKSQLTVTPDHVQEARRHCAHYFIEKILLPRVNNAHPITVPELVKYAMKFKRAFKAKYPNDLVGEFELIIELDIALMQLYSYFKSQKKRTSEQEYVFQKIDLLARQLGDLFENAKEDSPLFTT